MPYRLRGFPSEAFLKIARHVSRYLSRDAKVAGRIDWKTPPGLRPGSLDQLVLVHGLRLTPRKAQIKESGGEK